LKALAARNFPKLIRKQLGTQASN